MWKEPVLPILTFNNLVNSGYIVQNKFSVPILVPSVRPSLARLRSPTDRPKLELWTTNLFDRSLITVVTLFQFNLMIKMFILASVYNNADNISDSYDGFKNLTVNIDWLDVKTLIFWRTLIPCPLNFKSLNQALLLN